MRRNSQAMAQGMIPRVCEEASFPIMVYDLPENDQIHEIFAKPYSN
jgi:hypothetical protein